MKQRLNIVLAFGLCIICSVLSSCEKDDMLIDYGGFYYHLVKAQDNSFPIEEKDGEFHVDIAEQGGTYVFEFNPNAYYVIYDGKNKKERISFFNFIVWECYDDIMYDDSYWNEENSTEENFNKFHNKNNGRKTKFDCFFGSADAQLYSLTLTVKPNDQNRDRNIYVVLSNFPSPTAHIVLHQPALK